jgi:twinkle protein
VNRELEQYLEEKGWKYKLVEGQRQVQVQGECPFCNKDKHLMFHAESTKWDCKRCGESGNLLTMKKRLGDLKIQVRSARDFLLRRGPRDRVVLPGARPTPGIDQMYHERLFSGGEPEALEYLTVVRGFTEEILIRFKIGVADLAGKKMIAIPHYFGGELVCFKFRTIPPDDKAFTRWKDCPSVLFNGDCLAGLADLPARHRRVAVCEGEFDAMALVQLGYSKVVASTSGAGRGDWPEHWLGPLEPATTVYLAYDADEAGEEGASKAAGVLGRHRCRRMVPPLHDAAECVAAGLDRDVVQQCFREAAEYEESVVKPASAFLDDLRAMLDKGQPKGQSTGWVTLDSILGGIRDGELTVVTGDTGSGKSTWTTALARNQMMMGVPTLIMPFEQKPHEIVAKLTSMEGRRSIFDMTPVDREPYMLKAVKYPVFLVDRQGTTPLGDLKDAIYVAAQRYGVKFVVLDHLHFFLDCRPEEERTAINAVMRSLAVWVVDLNIHIVLVVHPTKLGKDRHGNVRKVILDDCKGSSEIKQNTWNAIRVYRDRQQIYGSKTDDTEIAVLKCRSPAGSEGATVFSFQSGAEVYIEGGNSLAYGSTDPHFSEAPEPVSAVFGGQGEHSWDIPH